MKKLSSILCLLILTSCSDQDSRTEEGGVTEEEGRKYYGEMSLELVTHLSSSEYFNFNSDEYLVSLKDFIKNIDTKNPYVILTIFGRCSSVQMLKTNIVW